MAFPYTGAYAETVAAVERGQQLPVQHINDSGGILGKKLVLEPRDDRLNFSRLDDNLADLVEEDFQHTVTYAFGEPSNSHLVRSVRAGVLTMSTQAELPPFLTDTVSAKLRFFALEPPLCPSLDIPAARYKQAFGQELGGEYISLVAADFGDVTGQAILRHRGF